MGVGVGVVYQEEEVRCGEAEVELLGVEEVESLVAGAAL